MHRSVADRSWTGHAVVAAPRTEPAPEARPPEQLLLTDVTQLQRAVGNAAVVRMLTPSPGPALARTLANKLEITGMSDAPVTPARLAEKWTAIDAAFNDLVADPQQKAHIDEARVNTWRADFVQRIANLRQEIALSAPPDVNQFGMPMAQIKGRADNVAEYFYLCIVSLNLVGNAVNKAWDAWNIEREVAAFAEQTAGYKQQEKEKGWAEQAKRDAEKSGAVEKDDDEDEDGPPGFPHKGKHAPKKKWLGKQVTVVPDVFADNIMEGNTKHPKAAAYKTRNTMTVLQWEATARENGLTLYGTVDNLAKGGGFTVIYGFTETIGADHGEMTRFIRIDGDHGHPIVESYQGLKTSFDSYVKKDVEVAKEAKNMQRLHDIWDFLGKLGLATSSYGIKSEPKVTAPGKPQ